MLKVETSHRLPHVIGFFAVFLLLTSLTYADEPLLPNTGSDATAEISLQQAAPLIVWNRTITVFRTAYKEKSPAQRAAAAAKRIEDLPEIAEDWKLEATEVTGGGEHGIVISAGSIWLFGILPGDLDQESGETLQTASQKALGQLREMLEARDLQQRPSVMLRAVVKSVVAIALFVALTWLILYLGHCIAVYIEKAAQKPHRAMLLKSATIVAVAVKFEKSLLRLITFTVTILLAYFCLVFVLTQFPYSRPWGTNLGSFLFGIFDSVVDGFIAAIPGFFTVLIIFLITRVIVKIVGECFRVIEQGKLWIRWLEPDTARATRRLLIAAIWLFSLTVAYPHIPGSNTAAFKGVTVFAGLMVSLGSTGMVNQIMSGLVAVYSRALRTGDYVKINDNEGVVTEVGLLSTKIVTPRREEITIPNAVLVGTTTMNYSRLAGREGAIVGTTITIGYDAPWRQVHAMLLLAAERTTSIRREPQPYVLQRALSDFYVEYELRVHLDRPENRVRMLSELHAQIQDAFNEFGVQIMSPHFETQPEGPVFVPKSAWFSPPAVPEPGDHDTQAKKTV
jgi:small-conductance mechanosensitive channel